MKAIYTLLLLLFVTFTSFAQQGITGKARPAYKYEINFDVSSKIGSSIISTPFLKHVIFRKISATQKDSFRYYDGILLGIVKPSDGNVTFGPGYIQSLSKKYRVATISDSSDIQVIAYGITPNNKNFFKYHVILDDKKELTPWTTPRDFEQQFEAERLYAVLWKGKALAKQVYVEVYDTRDFDTREGVLLNWNLKTKELPHVAAMWASKKYTKKGVQMQVDYNFRKDSLNSPFFSKFNTEYNYPEELHFRQNDFGEFRIYLDLLPGTFYSTTIKKIINDSISEYRYASYKSANPLLSIQEDVFAAPGNYEIEIYNVHGEEDEEGTKKQRIRIPVRVFPPPPKETTFTLKQMVPYAAAATLVAAFVFYLYYRSNKRKIAGIEMEKQISKLRLQSVRNQLNPHFVYNALAGIQNLLNKNDNRRANEYLTRFSRISRRVLEDAEKDLVTIEDEVKLLNDYLQMEQMRFGFEYSIQVDEAIDQTNTEIPAMLLQPFVENAVKHAMPAVADGCIGIALEKRGKSILVKIRDNGKGFNVHSASGTGSALSKNRISLLNEVYSNTPMILDVQSGEDGTTILLTLNDWLA
ncbi:sensor histidine kinase [Niabella drilacis]|uniref:Histidine kinase n=1 Tax=Niabella drilacis (strain DSM 25811 / CCM 8410 / CCUG 62505 / LMG 26954 / E90) TaxID=1285928 RepID=A0A1G6YPP1_NIADE|nr:histidine kinase [Niabella drilacis]SDD92281.1 Histidine kinase [Niabella drilacis]